MFCCQDGNWPSKNWENLNFIDSGWIFVFTRQRRMKLIRVIGKHAKPKFRWSCCGVSTVWHSMQLQLGYTLEQDIHNWLIWYQGSFQKHALPLKLFWKTIKTFWFFNWVHMAWVAAIVPKVSWLWQAATVFELACPPTHCWQGLKLGT